MGPLRQLDEQSAAGNAAGDHVHVDLIQILGHSVEGGLRDPPVVVALQVEGLHDVDAVGHILLHIVKKLLLELLGQNQLVLAGQRLSLCEAAGTLVVILVHQAEKDGLYIELNIQTSANHVLIQLTFFIFSLSAVIWRDTSPPVVPA